MFLLLNKHMYEVQTFKIHTIDIQTSTLTYIVESTLGAILKSKIIWRGGAKAQPPQ
mgnify:CR=1 FL=1